MKILFVDHVCHKKTRSADFFVSILRRRHEVVEFGYERFYRCQLPAPEVEKADILVFWEFLPSRFALGVPGKRCVFVPMFDNEWGSNWQWRRLARAGMNVISFCRAVTSHAQRCGVQTLLDVQFAFDPSQFENLRGNPRVALFWNRGAVDSETVRTMFAPGALDKLIVYDQFMPRDQYLEMIREVGIYVAPRFSEGIGMSFLEPLAMGKCVVAHDAPTMNEYIRDGVNGLLRDLRAPRQITADDVAKVLDHTQESAAALYRRWHEDEGRILEFIAEAARRPPLKSPWTLRSILAFVLYWLEGAKMRIFG